MYSKIDERNGLVMTSWQEVRDRVKKVDPIFTKLVDEINPSEKLFPLFLAYYPYGDSLADHFTFFLPTPNGNYFTLYDEKAAKEVRKHLEYGIDSCPLGMVLEKTIEYYADLAQDKKIIPFYVGKPGKFFNFARHLRHHTKRIYAPNGLLVTTSGARSTFMLPNIGCETNHVNLQRDFNIQIPAPKNLYDHWYLFKEILRSPVIKDTWRSCIMYFAENWITKLHNDKAWQKLKTYLFELGWLYSEYDRNHFYYDTSFSIIQQQRNLKPNPYLVDTAKHLITTALGAVPGHVPTCNDETLPLNILQKVFVDSYKLRKYIPTIISPMHFEFERDKNPVYYSLKMPSNQVFSPKSRKLSSTLYEMRELEHVTRIFFDELSKPNVIGSDTVLGELTKKIDIQFYHNELDRHGIIRSSDEIGKIDKRFLYTVKDAKVPGAKFAADSPFVRGCVSIKTKN